MTDQIVTPSLAKAMLEMPVSIEKDQENSFAHYQYSSADAVFANIRTQLAKQGLAPWQQEISMEVIEQTKQNKDGTERRSRWLKAKYQMALTPDGQAPMDNIELEGEIVTVMCEFTTAQAFAAIRTYALKYWLRGKLLLATGEFDADMLGNPLDIVPRPEKAPEKKPDGKWTIDRETFHCLRTGSFTSTIDSNRDLMRVLQRALSSEAIDIALKIATLNLELIEELPKAGQDVLAKKIKSLREQREAQDQ